MLLSLAVLVLARHYRIVDLGLPPGAAEVRAVAMDNRGEVLVSSLVPNAFNGGVKDERPYLWRKGLFIGFGDSPYAGMEGTSVKADALNDYGVVVGAVGGFGPLFMSGLEDKKAFVWKGRGMALLFPGDSIAQEAEDINDHGDILGTDGTYAFARLSGKNVGLPIMSAVEPRDPSGEMGDVNRSYATAINNKRQILMDSTYGGKHGDRELLSRPFLVDGNARRLSARPVPLPKGFVEGQGVALNDRGTVLAIATHRLGTDPTPYLLRGRRIVRLPFAGAMNNRDEVVGGSPLAVWRNGRTTPLPRFPGWVFETATGINDHGAICGTGRHEGKARAYVLLPE